MLLFGLFLLVGGVTALVAVHRELRALTIQGVRAVAHGAALLPQRVTRAAGQAGAPLPWLSHVTALRHLATAHASPQAHATAYMGAHPYTDAAPNAPPGTVVGRARVPAPPAVGRASPPESCRASPPVRRLRPSRRFAGETVR